MPHVSFEYLLTCLDGRNRAIVIAEPHPPPPPPKRKPSPPPPPNAKVSPHRPCLRCTAVGIARLAFIRVTFVPHGIAESPARGDHVRWMAIGDFAHLSPGAMCTSGPSDLLFGRERGQAKHPFFWAQAALLKFLTEGGGNLRANVDPSHCVLPKHVSFVGDFPEVIVLGNL